MKYESHASQPHSSVMVVVKTKPAVISWHCPTGTERAANDANYANWDHSSPISCAPNPRNSRHWRLVSHWNLPLGKAKVSSSAYFASRAPVSCAIAANVV